MHTTRTTRSETAFQITTGGRASRAYRVIRSAGLLSVAVLVTAIVAPAEMGGAAVVADRSTPLRPIAYTLPAARAVASPIAPPAAGSGNVVATVVLRARHAQEGVQVKREPRGHARSAPTRAARHTSR